jgi:hypothetical protein
MQRSTRKHGLVTSVTLAAALAVMASSLVPVHGASIGNSRIPFSQTGHRPYWRTGEYRPSEGYWNFGGCRRCDYWRCWWVC